jgi:gas vesicle protein
MHQYDEDDDEPYVVIEKHSGSVGSFLIGIAVGAGVALLMAPQSGAETRQGIRRGARRAGDAARDLADNTRGAVNDRIQQGARRVETRIDSARHAVDLKSSRSRERWTRGARRAAGARGPGAPHRRDEGAYHAGGDVARPVWNRRRVRRLTPRHGRRTSAGARQDGSLVRRAVPFFVRLYWRLRDYAERVWDNSGEDNIFFLAGGIAFNILLAAIPFILLLVTGLAYFLKQTADASASEVNALIDRLLPSWRGRRRRAAARR